jgi:succinate-semialdehyde dehydrogenase/glutarate-semialdehyde dehydrogenase
MYKDFVSINPATEEEVGRTLQMTDSELEVALKRATATQIKWRALPFTKRATLMKKLAKELRSNKKRLAEHITAEMGKTLVAAGGEIEKCALVCEFYADNTSRMLAPENAQSDAKKSYVRFDPLGVILAVMPWNFPLWQVFRFAAPALMAGNTGVLKHASNVQLCATAIESLFTKAGFPAGAFTNLPISSDRVEQVVRDPRIAAVTLTGSEKAGSHVAKTAGEELKKTVLELGGSDPFIVFKDADIEKATTAAVTARMQNNAGQSCIAAKRFIVDKTIEKKFAEALVEKVKSLKVGDPTHPETNVGPLASQQMLRDIERQVNESVQKGAKILVGGARIGQSGFFFAPTILSHVTKGMPAFDEELFGPVLPIVSFKSENEAIMLANDTPYGLGATIFTRNASKAEKFATRIDSGCVFINSPVKSDPRLPFGGVKKSGYGRELSHYGIKEFVNIKTVVLA